MIQFIKDLTESNRDLASAIKAQTEQEKHNVGRLREVIEKLDMVANLNDEFLQTIKGQVEHNVGAQVELTKKLDQFLGTLTSFFAFRKKQSMKREEEEEQSKPTPADLRY